MNNKDIVVRIGALDDTKKAFESCKASINELANTFVTISFFSIPLHITWCNVPGKSSRACLGMPYYPRYPQ